MVHCVAYGCYNSSKKKIANVHYFRFPRNEFRQLWIKEVRREDWEPNPNSRICSVHFEEKHMYKTPKNTTRLHQDAVPTIFPAFPSYLQKIKTVKMLSWDDSEKQQQDLSNCSAIHDLQRENERLKRVLRKKTTLIKSLQQNKRRNQRRISKLSTMLEILKTKNVLTQENIEPLADIPSPLAEIKEEIQEDFKSEPSSPRMLLEERDPLSTTNEPSPRKKMRPENVTTSRSSTAPEDVFDAIGKNVAHKLRGMSQQQRIIAEKIISDVMYHGQMETLTVEAHLSLSKSV